MSGSVSHSSEARGGQIQGQELFISYSRHDEYWLGKIRTHLKPLESLFGLVRWDDSRIQPGDVWLKEIEGALERAQVALLLVSPDFLASDFIQRKELPPLFEAAKKRGLRILWLPIRPCSWKRYPQFQQYQSVGSVNPTLAEMDEAERDLAMVTIADEIFALIPQELIQARQAAEGGAFAQRDAEERGRAELTTKHPAEENLVITTPSILPSPSGPPQSGSGRATPSELSGVLNSLARNTVQGLGENDEDDFNQFFFGRSQQPKDLLLVTSLRRAHFDFDYPLKKLLSFPDEYVPEPQGVNGWLAHEDMLVGTKLGELFGKKRRGQQKIIVTLDAENLELTSHVLTVAVGLGFTYHTRRLLSLSGLLGNVDIEWHEHTRTDAIKFGHKLFFEPHSPTEDVALVVRIVLGNGNVHFICAGRTASGTAAAGRYLSDHWDNIRDAYANHSGCDVSTHSLAVLIKHPSGFDAVCNKTERAFQVIMSASEFHVMP